MSPSSTGLIFDIKRFSIHDGPGIRTTVFFKGCPLHCAWCHNPEGISPLPEIHYWEKRCIGCQECTHACQFGALVFERERRIHRPQFCQGCGACAETCPAEAVELIGTEVSESSLMEDIEKDLIYYDQSGGGVTFSGGEPLMQIDFLVEMLKSCQDKGIHTAVDTSGQALSTSLLRVIPYTDLFLYDVKCLDNQIHFQNTGVPNQQILVNLEMLVNSGAKIIPRIPIIPGFNDDAENINRMGAFIANLGGIEQVNLLPFHRTAAGKYHRLGNHYSVGSVKPPSRERLNEIATRFEFYGLCASIGG